MFVVDQPFSDEKINTLRKKINFVKGLLSLQCISNKMARIAFKLRNFLREIITTARNQRKIMGGHNRVGLSKIDSQIHIDIEPSGCYKFSPSLYRKIQRNLNAASSSHASFGDPPMSEINPIHLTTRYNIPSTYASQRAGAGQ